MTDGRDAASLRTDTGVAGIVVAGGRSERYNAGDKALAELDGRPLVARAIDALVPVADELVVNCRRDQRDAIASVLANAVADDADVAKPDYRFAVDSVSGRGPVAGLRAALREADATYAVTVPCDMPFLKPAFLSTLLSRGRDRTGAVAEFDGRVEPFPAAVHVRSGTAAATEAVAAGVGSLRDYVATLEPDVVPENEVRAHVTPRCFFDVDSRSDLRRARELVRGAPQR